ncbi:SMC family ATPase [Streptomyces sp. NPDC049954]|uniref:SMC family ATPase n=1 Tax=Streptomyces sp. NPDC049954 TaxID=3155779 RepID=UPI0034166E7C
MRLHRLRVTAFGPFAGTQSVDFDSLSEAGLFLLHGPTGAGKTSVLDAVCYALYGSVPGARQSSGGRGEGLRSDHAAPPVRTEVQLELSIGGRRLEVTRQPAWERPKKRGTGTTLDKAQTWLREHEPATGWKDLSRSHQEVGEEIGALLGMSKDQFCQVVLLPQGEFARFLRADTAERGTLLGRLFDTRRFADVEQRLVDLGQRAGAGVKEGDTRILTLLHRLQQAAGARAELPAPQAQAGDPGLAGQALAYAAVARSAAREHRDLAGLREQWAGRSLAADRQDLDEQRARERLQARHAEALARAEALAAQAGQHQETVDRVERSRRAESVAPALGLRESEAAAHQEALEAERRARAALPAAHTGAGAATLAAAARRAHEERGTLTAARRAERRLSGIAEERRRLEREEHADDETRAEAEAWLEAWPGRQSELRARVTRAQEAATRVEQLTARIEPARARLDAARRRDRLAAEHARAAERAASARETRDVARQHWLDLREARLQGIAAELAEGLTGGQPCPVCGCAEHPAPRERGARHVDRAAEDGAHAAYQRADARLAEADHERAALAASREAAAETAGDGSVERLAASVTELEEERAAAHRTASGLHAAHEEQARTEREHERRSAAQQLALTRAATRAAAREALEREAAGLHADVERARDGAESVEARAAHLDTLAALLGEAAERAREAEEGARRLKDADARLADAAFRAGFTTPREAARALLPEAERRELNRRIDQWRQRDTEVRAVLADPEVAEAAGRPAARTARASARAEQAEERARTAASARDEAERRCTALDGLSAQLASEVRALGPLRTEYERIAGLAALATGRSADNERKMRLESYVLAARLEQVAAAASARLARMSAGRYTLVHSDDRGGRRRSGLGLHVVDAWTGRERDTASLSGGETFFVSLSLALGLADVVTDEAGGVRLDTLFIDEGFGSLDEQTLDEVMDVLDSLRERDRCVGVVSHVGDLRRRVHAQLEVVKGRAGSSVRQYADGAQARG